MGQYSFSHPDPNPNNLQSTHITTLPAPKVKCIYPQRVCRACLHHLPQQCLDIYDMQEDLKQQTGKSSAYTIVLPTLHFTPKILFCNLQGDESVHGKCFNKFKFGFMVFGMKTRDALKLLEKFHIVLQTLIWPPWKMNPESFFCYFFSQNVTLCSILVRHKDTFENCHLSNRNQFVTS